ncbi:MFS transporter [Herbidospora cretacea]|uniref:MFS transporter n=1 Tax=Herbidospora cretacea TaxID=28444 RepID=UPI0004C339CF|nr:MFS transporter [Herbidospora cretacea]
MTPPARRGGAIITALASAGIVVSVMQTIVIPIVPELPRYLHTDAASVTWVLTATLLAGAIATPLTGRLGDMFGKRRLLLICLGLLVIGSVVGALSSSLVPMIVGRALQGCAAGVIPLGISLMRDELAPERLGSAMGLMSSSLGVGGALGLPAAAAIAQNASWHLLFWGAAGLGLIAMVMVWTLVPESSDRSGGRIDFPGAIGLTAGLLCLLLAITKGGDWGWGGPLTLGLFGAALVILAVWGVYELRRPGPLVDLRTSARRPVLLTNIASIAIGFAMYAQALAIPQLLQLPAATGHGLGQSMLVAGLCMAPGGLVMIFVSPLSARLSAWKGAKVSLMTGALVFAAGDVAALWLLSAPWQLIVVSMITSTGMALAFAAIPALIMANVPHTETAAANGLNALMRSVGTSTASAVVGVALAHMTQPFAGTLVPTLDGFKLTFVLGAAAAMLAALIMVFVPGRQKSVAYATPTKEAAGMAAGHVHRPS